MATSKARFIITVEDDMAKEIEDYHYGNRYKDRTKAILALLRIGLDNVASSAKVAPSTPNLETGNPISPSETSRMPQDESKRQLSISGVKDTSASITGPSDKPEPLIDSKALDDMLADTPESQEPPRRPGRIRLSK